MEGMISYGKVYPLSKDCTNIIAKIQFVDVDNSLIQAIKEGTLK